MKEVANRKVYGDDCLMNNRKSIIIIINIKDRKTRIIRFQGAYLTKSNLPQ